MIREIWSDGGLLESPLESLSGGVNGESVNTLRHGLKAPGAFGGRNLKCFMDGMAIVVIRMMGTEM